MYKCGVSFICGLLFFTGFHPIFAQDFVFNVRHFKITEDANANYITGIEKDQNGLYWLASKNGLYRFDGSDFDPFGLESSQVELKDVVINGLAYSKARLYAATESGISVFNTINYKSETFDEGAAKGVAANAIEADSAANIFWISEDAFLNASIRGKFFRRKIPRKFTAASILIGSGSNIFLLSNEFLLAINKNSLETTSEIPIPGDDGYARFIGENEGKLYFLRLNFIYSVDTRNYSLSVFRRYDKWLSNAYMRGKEMFVIHQGNALWRYYSDGEGTGLSADSVDLGIGSPIYLAGIYDFGNQLMIRSTNGLFIVNLRPRLFKMIYSAFDSLRNSFYDPRGIAELNKRIYMFSYKRSAVYEPGKGIVSLNFARQPYSAHAVFKEHDTIWIACQGDGLVKYVPGLQKEEIFYPRIPDDPGVGLTSISPYGKDKFLLGSYSGLLIFDRIKNTFSRVEISMPRWVRTKAFIEDVISLEDGGFFIATTKGAYLVNRQFVVERIFSPNDRNSLSDQAHDLWLSPKGLLWVGTSNGLFCYSIEGKIIRHFTTRQGLAGDRIASIQPDLNGNLWVGTFSGLSCITAGNGAILNFYTDAGLPDNEFNHSSALLTSTGEIVLGTVKGFVIFNPAACLRPDQRISKVTFSKLIYGSGKGEAIDYNPESNPGNEIMLGKDINYLKIYLGLGDMPFLSNVFFEYRIKGVHDGWQMVSRDNILRLDNLRPGNYKLLIRKVVEGNEVLAEIREVSLVVRQYFFNSIWFYILILLIISSLIIWNLRTSLARERRIQQLRRVISRNLHDEVGSYLTGISMNLDLLRKKIPEVNKYQQAISQLSKKAMFALKDGLWSLDSETDKGELFWDRLKVIAREMFEPLDVEYQLGNSEIIAGYQFSGLQKNQLIYVIKECFANALKYGKNNPVIIKCKKVNGRPAIQISNLKSRSDDEAGGFHGLVNINHRMHEIGGEVEISEDEHNFTVQLILKFLK